MCLCLFTGMGTGITLTGKLEAGKLQSGDKVVVMPAGEQGLVKGELILHNKQGISGKFT